MKITLDVNTKNMTKEERLAIKHQLQKYLNTLDAELDEMIEEKPLSNEAITCTSSNFFGVAFDFESMPEEELQSNYDEAWRLWTAISEVHFPNIRSQDSKIFFGVEFNFWNMNGEQLSNTRDAIRCLLRTIENYLPKSHRTSSHTVPH